MAKWEPCEPMQARQDDCEHTGLNSSHGLHFIQSAAHPALDALLLRLRLDVLGDLLQMNKEA